MPSSMAGIWKVEQTKRGTGVLYIDWTTHELWDCGLAPKDIPLTNTLSWVAEKINACDLIEVNGHQFACYFGQNIYNPALQ
jgi:hypothetical protein